MTYGIRTTYKGKRSEIKKTYATKAEATADANFVRKDMKEMRKKYGISFATHTNIVVFKK